MTSLVPGFRQGPRLSPVLWIPLVGYLILILQIPAAFIESQIEERLASAQQNCQHQQRPASGDIRKSRAAHRPRWSAQGKRCRHSPPFVQQGIGTLAPVLHDFSTTVQSGDHSGTSIRG